MSRVGKMASVEGSNVSEMGLTKDWIAFSLKVSPFYNLHMFISFSLRHF